MKCDYNFLPFKAKFLFMYILIFFFYKIKFPTSWNLITKYSSHKIGVVGLTEVTLYLSRKINFYEK